MGKKLKNPDKVPFGIILTWALPGLSLAAQMMVIGQVNLFSTSVLGLEAGLIAGLMVASKVIDCFTDFVVGYLVDNTNSKWGRGRPYDFCAAFTWVFTVLIYLCPPSFSKVGKCVWIMVFYVLMSSGFYSIYSAAQGPYMVRAFNNNNKYVQLNSYSGLITMLGAVVVNIIMPQLLAKDGTREGWIRMVLIFAVPLAIISLIRFFVIKEKYSVDAKTEHIKFKEIIEVLKINKNLYPIALMMLVVNVAGNIGVSTYYYQYVVGDIGLASIGGALQIVMVPVMFIFPPLLKKIKLSTTLAIGFALCIVGNLINWFAYDNVALLILGGVFTGIGAVPNSMFSGLLLLQCADYNEWKDKPRMEATMSALPGLMANIGTALGMGLLGLCLSIGGFVSSTEGVAYTQPESAITMLRLLISFIPMALYAMSFIAIRFYKLEDQLPQMTSDLAIKRASYNHANDEVNG